MKWKNTGGIIGGLLAFITSLVVVAFLVTAFTRTPMGMGAIFAVLGAPIFSAFVTGSAWFGYRRFSVTEEKPKSSTLIFLALFATFITIFVINVFIWYGIETMPCGWGHMDGYEYERCQANQKTFWEFIRWINQSHLLNMSELIFGTIVCSPISFIVIHLDSKRRQRKVNEQNASVNLD